MVCLEYRH